MSSISSLDDIKGLLIVANNNGIDTSSLLDVLIETQEIAFEKGYNTSCIMVIVDILKCQEDTIDVLSSLSCDKAFSKREKSAIVSPPTLADMSA